MSESLYGWIEKPEVLVQKPAMYRSRHDPYTAPVGTTFGLQGTQRLVGSTGNCLKSDARSFGKAKGQSSAAQDQFLKSTRRGPVPRSSAKFERSIRAKKPTVPRKSEAPIMGLKTTKNFVVANAVENILAGACRSGAARAFFRRRRRRARAHPPPPISARGRRPLRSTAAHRPLPLFRRHRCNRHHRHHAPRAAPVPRQVGSPAMRYTEKRDYGKVPQYLDMVKRDIEEEQAILAEYFKDEAPVEEQQSGIVMSDGEREELVLQLKKQWGVMNSRFQLISHNTVLDSVGKVRRKTELEKALDQLSADIKLLTSGRPIEVVQ
jgi:hypothetical protein